MAHQVRVNAANTVLPNGRTYQNLAVVFLSDEEYARISPTLLSAGAITDQGEHSGKYHSVTVAAGKTANLHGFTWPAGSVVVVTDADLSRMSGAIQDGTLTDNGEVTATAHMVTAHVDNLTLPNGDTVGKGRSAVLTPEQFARLNPAVFSDNASPGRAITAALTTGQPTIVATAAANLTLNDANRTVVDTTTGANVPAATHVLSVQDATHATLDKNAAATAAADSLTLGALSSLTDNGTVTGV